MDARLILIDSAAELARAHALVARLWDSDAPAAEHGGADPPVVVKIAAVLPAATQRAIHTRATIR